MACLLTLLALRALGVFAAPKNVLQTQDTDSLIPSSTYIQAPVLIEGRKAAPAADAVAVPQTLIQITLSNLHLQASQHTKQESNKLKPDELVFLSDAPSEAVQYQPQLAAEAVSSAAELEQQKLNRKPLDSLPPDVASPRNETDGTEKLEESGQPHLIGRSLSETVSHVIDIMKRRIKKKPAKSLPPGVSSPRLLTGGSRELEPNNQPHIVNRAASPELKSSSPEELEKRRIEKGQESRLPDGVERPRLLTGGNHELEADNQPHVVQGYDSAGRRAREKRRIKKKPAPSLPPGVSSPRLLTGGSRELEKNNQPHVVGRTLESLLHGPH